MGEPPVDTPLFQVIPITDAVVTCEFIARPTGADGTNKIVAPFPCSESADSPYRFDVDTLAKIESPSVRLNGTA